MNEANMFELFKKRHMPVMKRLTEGYGQAIENKFVQPFTGFVGSYQLITCNYLVCPFVEPVASNSGWGKYEYEYENSAMMSRVRLVRFDRLWNELNLLFKDKEWAQSLLYMAENLENIPPPDPSKLFESQRVENGGQSAKNSQFHPPEGVLIADNNDLK